MEWRRGLCRSIYVYMIYIYIKQKNLYICIISLATEEKPITRWRLRNCRSPRIQQPFPAFGPYSFYMIFVAPVVATKTTLTMTELCDFPVRHATIRTSPERARASTRQVWQRVDASRPAQSVLWSSQAIPTYAASVITITNTVPYSFVVYFTKKKPNLRLDVLSTVLDRCCPARSATLTCLIPLAGLSLLGHICPWMSLHGSLDSVRNSWHWELSRRAKPTVCKIFC